MHFFDLHDRTAVVIGGSSGIGLATAELPAPRWRCGAATKIVCAPFIAQGLPTRPHA